jgi:TonB family protein
MSISIKLRMGALAAPLAISAIVHAGDEPDRRAKFDPHHPPRIGRDYYPKAALRAHQQGKCIVRITFDASGDVQDVVLVSSSGYPLLDQASLSAWKPGHVVPAEQNGVPVAGTADFAVAWTMR